MLRLCLNKKTEIKKKGEKYIKHHSPVVDRSSDMLSGICEQLHPSVATCGYMRLQGQYINYSHQRRVHSVTHTDSHVRDPAGTVTG